MMVENGNDSPNASAHTIRYNPEDKRDDLVSGAAEHMEVITAHVEEHVGEVAKVFHEIISTVVHIDILIVEPTPDRKYYTLVTSGMSDLPMNAPEELEDASYAELVICLPSDWPLQEKDLEDGNNYWPIRLIKMLARFPHEYNSWLWVTHSVPNGDPPASYARNTKLCCALIDHPFLIGPEFSVLEREDGEKVFFLSVVPLYKEEMEYKLKHGYDALVEKLDDGNVSMLLNVRRKNICKRGFLGLSGG